MSLFPENQSGIIWILTCLIILTLSAVFLSMLMEKRFNFSQQKLTLAARIASQKSEINALQKKIVETQSQLQQLSVSAAGVSRENVALLPEVARLEQEISDRRTRREALPDLMQTLKNDFAAYSERYRIHSWKTARGEKINRLLTKTGRQFNNAIITAVTPLGLTISHSSGSTRIPFDDLGIEYHQRFQWTGEMRENSLRKPNPSRPQPLNQIPEPVRTQTPPAKTTDPDNELIAQRASELTAARSIVARVRSEHSNALMQSRSSRQRSVPGRLRTWAEQVKILENQLQRAITLEALARENLRALAPNHPALQIIEQDYQ